MTQPVLEPYALQQHWTAGRPLESGEWAALFSEYLAALARACAAASRQAVIGHIKLLALFDEGHYLRVSVVSPTHPVTVTGVAPDNLEEVTVTLNVLVYGLTAAQLAGLTSSTAGEAAARRGATVEAEDHHHEKPDRSSET
jgi:hypothetical protein